MPAKLILEITSGPLNGYHYAFVQHDILLVGRHADCHARLPKDRQVSRHHCLVEINPPEATLRDLGSRNGTYVNGVRHGGRALNETPQQGSSRCYPEIRLKPGDQIKVGETAMNVVVQVSAACGNCGRELDETAAEVAGQSLLCAECERKLATQPLIPTAVPEMRCQNCGKPSANESQLGRHGEYVCRQCREGLLVKDGGLRDLLQQAVRGLREKTTLAIAGYEIGDVLGKGGMGIVYRAIRKSDQCPLAVKAMLPSIAINEESRRRFLREIEILRQLQHPHIVRLLDHGSAGGAFYFVMDYCNAGSLASFLLEHQGKLSLERAAPLMMQCLHALEHAHAARFVHRDLKPQNILLQKEQNQLVAKISDFGLAKQLEQAGFSGMTATGRRGGTCAYMPREQLTDFKRVEPISDVWSLAATFYNMLTGFYPRDFGSGRDPIEVILQDEPIAIRQREATVPPSVAAVIDQALSNSLTIRYPSAAEFRGALEPVLMKAADLA